MADLTGQTDRPSLNGSAEGRGARALRWALAALLIWAALSKLANPSATLGHLYAYQLPVPAGLLKLAAVTLPWIELLCGLMLLSGWGTDGALLLVAGLVTVFLLATGLAWARGLSISCGCFDLRLVGLPPGSAATRFLESPAAAFLRNLLLAAVTVWLLRPLWRERQE
jgi:uncharacterized membrane protein YphA (DoxX/SURF4 family)